uniref:(northern house mosquito) hypothetical protein n=1 Tax=Culex pipiens TaxID=7175 RepID=A0A8D8BJP0_CULPI
MSEHVQTRSNAVFSRPTRHLATCVYPPDQRGKTFEKVPVSSFSTLPFPRDVPRSERFQGRRTLRTRRGDGSFISEASRSSYFHELFDGKQGGCQVSRSY